MTNLNYYNQTRLDLLPLIDKTYSKVIEFGCGQGQTLKYLKEHRIANQTYGIENHPPSFKIAQNHVDNIWQADAQTFPIPKKLKFDLILLPDILEHLIDPWTFLTKLHKNTKPNTEIIVSIPNVQHYTIIINLLKGQWPYANSGIMDRTHLRYFTKLSATQMFLDTNYQIITVKYNGGTLTSWKSLLNSLSQNRIKPWFVSQWLFKLKPIN